MVVLSLSTQDDTKNKGYFGPILKGAPKNVKYEWVVWLLIGMPGTTGWCVALGGSPPPVGITVIDYNFYNFTLLTLVFYWKHFCKKIKLSLGMWNQ